MWYRGACGQLQGNDKKRPSCTNLFLWTVLITCEWFHRKGTPPKSTRSRNSNFLVLFKWNPNLNLNLYREIPRNLIFWIWSTSGMWHFQLKRSYVNIQIYVYTYLYLWGIAFTGGTSNRWCIVFHLYACTEVIYIHAHICMYTYLYSHVNFAPLCVVN